MPNWVVSVNSNNFRMCSRFLSLLQQLSRQIARNRINQATSIYFEMWRRACANHFFFHSSSPRLLCSPGRRITLEPRGRKLLRFQGMGQWHYLALPPHARGEVAVAEANGKVYVLGGYADGLSAALGSTKIRMGKNVFRRVYLFPALIETWSGKTARRRWTPLPNPRVGWPSKGNELISIGAPFLRLARLGATGMQLSSRIARISSSVSLVSQFQFESKLSWPNLHHFLYILGRARNGAFDSGRVAVRQAPLDKEGFDKLPTLQQKAWRARGRSRISNPRIGISLTLVTAVWWT